MKKTILAVALLGILGTANATYCTNGATDYPTCTPPVVSPPKNPPVKIPAAPISSKSGSVSGADSASRSVSESSALLTGEQILKARQDQLQEQNQRQAQLQEQANKQKTDQSVILEGDGAVDARSVSLGLTLPGLASAGDIAASGCPDTKTTKSASGWGAGVIYSGSDAVADNEGCEVRLATRQAYIECQFLESKALRTARMQKLMPNYVAPNTGKASDLTPEECAKYRSELFVTQRTYDQRQYQTIVYEAPPPAPAPVPETPAEPPVVTLLIPPPPSSPAPCGAKQKRNSKGVCYTPVLKEKKC